MKSARSLSSALPETAEPAPAFRPAPPAVEDEPDALPSRAELTSGFSRPQPARPEREPAEAVANGEGSGTGPRRERLRLKPVQRPATGPDA